MDDTAPHPALAAPTGEPDRTTRYLARLDEKLAALPADEARALLSREFVIWAARYERFVAESYNDTPEPADGPTAFDYVMTITSIGSRMSKHDERRAA